MGITDFVLIFQFNHQHHYSISDQLCLKIINSANLQKTVQDKDVGGCRWLAGATSAPISEHLEMN